MPQMNELQRLRLQAAHDRAVIEELRKIASGAALQANELKAWILVLLRKVGPQKVALADWDAVGEKEGEEGVRALDPERIFMVEEIADEPGMVLLHIGSLEDVGKDAPEEKPRMDS